MYLREATRGEQTPQTEAVELCVAELNALFELLESMNWIPRSSDELSAVEVQMMKWKTARKAIRTERFQSAGKLSSRNHWRIL